MSFDLFPNGSVPEGVTAASPLAGEIPNHDKPRS